jgi:hypothetical protein
MRIKNISLKDFLQRYPLTGFEFLKNPNRLKDIVVQI